MISALSNASARLHFRRKHAVAVMPPSWSTLSSCRTVVTKRRRHTPPDAAWGEVIAILKLKLNDADVQQHTEAATAMGIALRPASECRNVRPKPLTRLMTSGADDGSPIIRKLPLKNWDPARLNLDAGFAAGRARLGRLCMLPSPR
jgi:hypothetical protein